MHVLAATSAKRLIGKVEPRIGEVGTKGVRNRGTKGAGTVYRDVTEITTVPTPFWSGGRSAGSRPFIAGNCQTRSQY